MKKTTATTIRSLLLSGLFFVGPAINALAGTQAAAALMHNGDVVSLKNAGLTDDLIILKIQHSATAFRMDAAELIALKDGGISDVVIAEMLKSPTDQLVRPSADSRSSTVYIYRYKQFVGSALGPSVYCDENELARMDNGRYFLVELPPGTHTFRSNDKQS
jgi:hypothetical protein